MKKIKKLKTEKLEILTIDQSLNGSGIIYTVDGEVKDLWYMTDKKKNVSEHSLLICPKKLYEVERLEIIKQWFIGILNNVGVNCIIGLEGYAYGARGRVFELGELGGLVKLIAWEQNKRCISIPPDSIKQFATGKGNAVKSMMVASAITQHDIDFSIYGESGEDLADAFWSNKLIYTMEQVRKNPGLIKKLPPHQKEAITKKHKKNPSLLEMEYVSSKR